ncbi:FAD binding domain-containing protein [Paraburkholderia hospita]|uniref:FAD binding domain-containing protein n=1 Tax=Paraburkholderia hospita TaxID=169430 RepID=UPI000B343B47|nr:xanthine dehydrogenase family protein subunit M [Paraburkholderia hospita]OUL90378.1 xanthine dehydrogenase [Paraburkholderia hospita]
MKNFDYIRATSVDSAVATVSEPDAVFLAGGTTLLDLLKLDVMRPALVVDIHKLRLNQIEPLPDGSVRIGAMVTNTDLAFNDYIRAHYPVLSQALRSGASTQLRNKATTAGNIMQRVRCGYFRDGISACNKRNPGSGCAAIGGQNRNVHAVLGGSEHCIAAHPSDMCVAMAAIGATIHVQGPAGRRDIDFGEFHLLPGDTPWREHSLQRGEMITHVTLNAPMHGGRSAYLKLRDRASYQFALASCAAIVALEGGRIRDARIALGGVATKPWRALEAEDALKGQVATDSAFERAAALALRDARSYGQNGFKIGLGQQAVVRNLTSLVA